MLPRLKEAKYLGGHRIRVVFEDGVAGEVDLADELWGEVFEPLRDLSRFAQMRFDADLGTVVWPNGADFAPEFLYEKLQKGYRLGESRAGVA